MKKNRVYFYAVLVAIGVIVINQIFIQYWLYQKREDGKIINIGGRQRMLSQKLIVQVFTYREEPTYSNLHSFLDTYRIWKEAHQYLEETFSRRPTSSLLSSNVYVELEKLDLYFTKIEEWKSNPNDLSSLELAVFKNDQEEFLIKMNKIVGFLEAEANHKLNILILIEILFAFISLLLIYYEITYVFKRMNNRLEKRNNALSESNLMLEKFAYLAAHDLKAPSLNIYNFARTLKMRLSHRLKKSELEYFEVIVQASKRLFDTTDDLLRFSTISGKKIKVEKFEPQKMLNAVIEDLDSEIKEKKAEIEVENIPDSIVGDPQLLRLVFQNLISNGMKFVDKQVIPNLKIKYHYNHAQHIFSIQDNGIGIEEKDRNKIFGLFKRLHCDEKYEGTGIGLSICQKVLEKHKGEIALESEPEKGSTFKVIFPKYLQN